jgi:hypothetical protein
MSDVTRYDGIDVGVDAGGEFVAYSDYARLTEQLAISADNVNRLSMANSEQADLIADLERQNRELIKDNEVLTAGIIVRDRSLADNKAGG